MAINYKYIIIPALIVVLAINKTFGQNDCQSALNQAFKYYEQGYYDKTIQLFEEKIDNCRYTKEEYLQALKTLISAYSEIDEIEKSEKNMRKFLRKSPYYKVNNRVDPISFINTYNNFSVRPRICFGAYASLGKVNPIVSKSYIVFSEFDYRQPYSAIISTSFNTFVEYNIFKNISLGISGQLQILNFSKTYNYGSSINVAYTENAMFFNAQTYFKFNFFTARRFQAEILLGIHRKSLARAEYKATLTAPTNVEDNELTTSVEEGIIPEIKRATSLYGTFVGGRVKFKLSRIDVFAQLTYSSDFEEYINPEQVNPGGRHYLDFYHIDNALKLNVTEFSLGFSFNFLNKIRRKY